MEFGGKKIKISQGPKNFIIHLYKLIERIHKNADRKNGIGETDVIGP